MLRVETAAALFSILCFIISIYVVGLSLQVSDEQSRAQLVISATISFFVGIVILVMMFVSYVIKRLFPSSDSVEFHRSGKVRVLESSSY